MRVIAHRHRPTITARLVAAVFDRPSMVQVEVYQRHLLVIEEHSAEAVMPRKLLPDFRRRRLPHWWPFGIVRAGVGQADLWFHAEQRGQLEKANRLSPAPVESFGQLPAGGAATALILGLLGLAAILVGVTEIPAWQASERVTAILFGVAGLTAWLGAGSARSSRWGARRRVLVLTGGLAAAVVGAYGGAIAVLYGSPHRWVFAVWVALGALAIVLAPRNDPPDALPDRRPRQTGLATLATTLGLSASVILSLFQGIVQWTQPTSGATVNVAASLDPAADLPGAPGQQAFTANLRFENPTGRRIAVAGSIYEVFAVKYLPDSAGVIERFAAGDQVDLVETRRGLRQVSVLVDQVGPVLPSGTYLEPGERIDRRILISVPAVLEGSRQSLRVRVEMIVASAEATALPALADEVIGASDTNAAKPWTVEAPPEHAKVLRQRTALRRGGLLRRLTRGKETLISVVTLPAGDDSGNEELPTLNACITNQDAVAELCEGDTKYKDREERSYGLTKVETTIEIPLRAATP